MEAEGELLAIMEIEYIPGVSGRIRTQKQTNL